MSTADKIELINRLSATGLRSIETTSFVSPKWIRSWRTPPRSTPASSAGPASTTGAGAERTGLRPRPAVGVEGVHRCVRAFNRTNTNAGIDESLARFEPILRRAAADGVRVRSYVSTVLGCPQGEVPLADVVRVARALHQMGCYEISLGDTIGVGTPQGTGDAAAVAAEIPMDALAVHFHDTYGQAIANIATCLEEGVRVVDSAVSVPVAADAKGPAATSPARTWSTCCGAWAWTAASTCRHWPRPAAGWLACSAAPPPHRTGRSRRPAEHPLRRSCRGGAVPGGRRFR